MPLNEIPKYFNPVTRRLVDAALEDAWQELKKDGLVEAHPGGNEIGDNNRSTLKQRLCLVSARITAKVRLGWTGAYWRVGF